MGRLKTGTPAQLDGKTIHWDRLEQQLGDDPIQPFSMLTPAIEREQIACGITYTNEKTHAIIADRLNEFSGLWRFSRRSRTALLPVDRG
ncbi:tRNA uridine 5-carboxymethylaminomethyl modification enzyme MnmG [Asticcacaulis sp. MM231]